MAGYGAAAWGWWLGGAALAAIAILLLIWSLWWDRPHGRRRCPRCWYDLSGTDSLTCSECGKAATSERKLFKTRRRWRWAALAVIVLLSAGVLALTPKVKRDGVWSLVNNRNLVRLLMISWSGDGWVADEISSRMSSTGPFWDADDCRFLYERCAAGDVFARPVSEAWKRKYGRLIDRLQFIPHRKWNRLAEHGTDPNPVTAALRTIPPDIGIRTRDAWPEDVDVYYEVRALTWWPYPDCAVVDATPPIDSTKRYLAFDRFHLVVPAEAFANGSIPFKYTVRSMQPGKPVREWEVIEEQAAVLDPTFRGGIEDNLTPVTLDAFTKSLPAKFPIRLDFSRNGIGQDYDHKAFALPELRGIAFGVMMEFIYDGEVVVEWPLWWEGGSEISFPTSLQFCDNFDRLRDTSDPGGWTLRMRSEPALALRVLDADRSWQGEVELALTLKVPVPEPDPAPAAE